MIYALLGEVVLGLGDGECGDAAAGGAGGFDGEATPAAADFENVVVGLDVGESDELVDFGFLGVGEGLIGVLEEGGGVEHGFGVEKGLVEVVAEIVVGLNVFSAAGFGVSVGGGTVSFGGVGIARIAAVKRRSSTTFVGVGVSGWCGLGSDGCPG